MKKISFKPIRSKLLSSSSVAGTKAKQTLRHYPLTSFLFLLGLLLGLIYLSNYLRKPIEKSEIETQTPKAVQTYPIGSSPKITTQAKIEKSGVVTIVAQTSAVVQSIYAKEGAVTAAGSWIIGLSTTYQGGNSMSLQRQIAQKNYEFNKSNLDIQREVIAKNRQIAIETDINSDEMRKITQDTLNNTRSIIDNSRNTLDLVTELITYHESISTATLTDNATDEQVISGLKQQRIGLLSGLNAADQALATNSYTADEDHAPSKLADLSKDITIKQLDLQEKSLQLQLEISELNYRLASVNEALMYPAAPFEGTIQHIHVRVGQVVNPGDAIATLSGSDQTITALALVPKDVAQKMSKFEPSRLMVNNQSMEVLPSHIATEPTTHNLFGVRFPIPKPIETKNSESLPKGGAIASASTTMDLASSLTEGQLVTIQIPVGMSQTSSVFPFVPLDAMFQTQDQAYVFVLANKKAEVRTVELGEVIGGFVQVNSGLKAGDIVILDRTVISGDPIQPI